METTGVVGHGFSTESLPQFTRLCCDKSQAVKSIYSSSLTSAIVIYDALPDDIFSCLSTVGEAPDTKPTGLDAPHHGPVWLSVPKRGFLPSPERRAAIKGLPSGPCLSHCFSSSHRGQGTRLSEMAL